VTVSDNYISKTVKFLANCKFSDEKIIGGECSTPGIVSLVGLCNDVEIKKKINLNEGSNVLLFGCEGDADEELYQKLLNS
jgi:diaminopropionate ammonia-lyase